MSRGLIHISAYLSQVLLDLERKKNLPACVQQGGNTATREEASSSAGGDRVVTAESATGLPTQGAVIGAGIVPGAVTEEADE